MQSIRLTRPDDWHLHLRDGERMKSVLPHSARQFGRAVIMPNLTPPVRSVEAALNYRNRILSCLPPGVNFNPLMALYLSSSTSLEMIKQAADSDHIIGFKLYPAGATTHSDAGISDPSKIYDLYEAMEKVDIPLLIHGEVTDPAIDIFDREKVFISRYLEDIVKQFPQLRVVLEHATTREAVDFVKESSPSVAATLTPQHLMYNRNVLLAGGIKAHFYCLPVLKRESHRTALRQAATSGSPKFFLGTDSAPHARPEKESACGCAGCYSAHAALEMYAEVFEEEKALEKLEPFASFYGPDFYRVPRNQDTVTLQKERWRVPDRYPFDEDCVVPLRAGEQIRWKFSETTATETNP